MSHYDDMLTATQRATTRLFAHFGVESGSNAAAEFKRLIRTDSGRTVYEIYLREELARRHGGTV